MVSVRVRVRVRVRTGVRFRTRGVASPCALRLSMWRNTAASAG